MTTTIEQLQTENDLLRGVIERIRSDFAIIDKQLDPHLVTPHRIISACASVYGTNADAMRGCGKKSQRVSHARQLAMVLMREVGTDTMDTIAKRFMCNHSAVSHATKAVASRSTWPDEYARVSQVRRILGI